MEFNGFEHLSANYIYCPNQFFEVCLRHQSRGCVRLVAYLIRKTLGYLDKNGNPIKEDIRISYADFSRYAGVSTRSIPKALDDAESGGFISCVTLGIANSCGQRGQAAEYRLRWSDDDYTNNPEQFNGFYAGDGNRSPIPNGFFDIVVPQETLVMTKVVGTILRHTVGYQNQFGGRRSEAPLSFSYIQQYANMGDRTALSNALKDSIKKGYIHCASKGYFDPNAGRHSRSASYAVKWLDKDVNNIDTAKTLPDKIQDGRIPTEKTAKTIPDKHGKIPTDRKTLENNTYKQQSVAAVENLKNTKQFQLLRKAGFDESVALELSESRGLDEIQQQIDWLPHRNADRNPLGMLRKAIQNDWSKPESICNAEKKEQRLQDDQTKATEAEIEEGRVLRAKKEKKHHRGQLLPIWNGLSSDEQIKIKQTTFKQLNSDFLRDRFKKNKEFQLNQCLDQLAQHENADASKVDESD
jgi:hypothetical protein